MLRVAHDVPLLDHLGIKETNHILNHFYWPTIRMMLCIVCRTCPTCQMLRKPNRSPTKAPLKPAPAFDEPFSKIIIDCVGPLPKIKLFAQY